MLPQRASVCFQRFMVRQCANYKQAAAVRSVEQIAEFIRRHPYSVTAGDKIEFLFDEAILGDPAEFNRHLQTLSPSPVASAAVTSVRSHENAVVQLADILAGFGRLATEIALGRANKEILVRDDGFDSDIPIDLLSYISIALRWAMWGEVPPPPDPNNVTFRCNLAFQKRRRLRIANPFEYFTANRTGNLRIASCLHGMLALNTVGQKGREGVLSGKDRTG